MARVTIADVAARAEVSKSTVSHALSGKRPISEETRQRIQQAVEALGYRPDPVARRLAMGGRSRGIGFVYPLFVPQVAGLELRYVASAAQVINAADYAFLLLTHLDRSSQHLERLASSGLVDGFILMQVQMHDPRVQFLQRLGIPFVLIGRCADNTGLAFVDAEIEVGIRQCVDHLVGLGHRHLAFLYQDDPEFGYAARAAWAYRDACKLYGLPPVMQACDFSPEAGGAAMRAVLERRPDATAWIVSNDSAAWGLAKAAEVQGLRIPEDLSMICLNYSSMTRLLDFQPAVLDIRAEEVATRAAEMMLRMLRLEPVDHHQVLVTPDFIVGDSTAPPRRTVPDSLPPVDARDPQFSTMKRQEVAATL